MTAKLLTLEDGQNLTGYRNYLGREVLGAWAWDEYLGFGVASEIGVKEAYAGLDTSLMTIRLFAGCIILLLITLAILQHRYRMKRHAQEREILNALDQAEHANQSKMVFLSSMSHELRTPLNAVIGFSDLLLQEKSVQANPEHVEQLGHIHQSGEHLLKLVDEVLEFAKLDLGALSFRFEKVPVGVVIAESLSMMEQAAKKHDIALRCGNDDLRSLPHIWTDPTRLRQVLLNLLSNAIKYNHAGGFVTLRASIEATSLKIGVEDSGRGIAPEDLPSFGSRLHALAWRPAPLKARASGLPSLAALLKNWAVRLTFAVRKGAVVSSGSKCRCTFRKMLNRPRRRRGRNKALKAMRLTLRTFACCASKTLSSIRKS